MRLILHAGTHKTGTTSIQKALFDNQTWLRQSGLVYPDGGDLYRKSRLAHHYFVRAFTGTSAEDLALAAEFLDRIRTQIRNPDDTIIISAEPVYRHIDGYVDWQHFADADYWVRRNSYLSRLANALHDFDVTVVIFFRERASFARSLYGEVVNRKGHWQGSPREFMIHFHHWFEYKHQIAAFQAAFGDVRTCSYERAVDKGLIRTFFETIGFPMPPNVEQIWERKTADTLVNRAAASRGHSFLSLLRADQAPLLRICLSQIKSLLPSFRLHDRA
jgi:hypothetical protein